MLTTPVLNTAEHIEDEVAAFRQRLFFDSLRESKLLLADTVDCVEKQAARAGLDAVQRMLVAGGLLTRYQLDRVTAGRGGGLVLGQYRVLEELGAGGFGHVYKANHAILDRIVALKVMTPAENDEEAFREVFRREIAATTRLNHPNVVTTYDANEIDGRMFLAMEYVNGPSLDSYLRKYGPPPIPVACAILLDVCQGLQHAHDSGIVHRDIKPANILVPGLANGDRPDPECPVLAKVIDFGLSKLRQLDGRSVVSLMANEGAFVGTPAFVAPEQVLDFHKADRRSDLYSLGCMMYVLLTGQLPFRGGNVGAIVNMQLSATPRPIRDLRPETPVGLAAIVKQLMAKKPEDRFQSAADLTAAVGAFVASAAWIEASPPPTTVGAPSETAVMPPQHAPSVEPARETAAALPLADAQRVWQQWCAILETHQRGEPLTTTEAGYAGLYGSLIRSLRAGAWGNDTLPPEKRDRLQTLVEPWVTLRAIRTLDAAACDALLDECERVDPSLRSPAMSGGRVGQAATLAAIVAVVAAVAWVASRWQSLAAAGWVPW